MEQRFSLVTLGVADLPRARAFYEQGLGWSRGNTEDEVAFYQLPGVVLALWSRAELATDAAVTDDGGGFGGVCLAYNTRSHDEVDEVLARAAAAGARITKPGTEVFWGGYSGYFADLDGHLWEVAWNPGWSIDEAGRITMDAPAG